ncbi:hypothetical protein HNE_0124 [Hyphomonas neptunium ATCC 15444]|uniref:Lipoprotein n=2 Tax=Hyphomonas TaxID=85 RepID=Q0C5Y5_HYPNA|nr:MULTISPECIES: hypothetical protein [Hyphomonas]ABI77170.1 hypothetical protein HNE_0124 [Hyphomonas neptunium ATCC 15444]KCZ89392.1 hypothetical protein HHI_14617 [Hyphomonas hirschiana VP5]
MLKRVFLLSLSLWLMIAGGLAADASPCHMQEEMTPAPISAAETGAHDHCAMMAEEAPTETPADAPGKAPATDAACCCPAVLAALPAPALPEAATVAFTLPASFPLDASAPSRTLIPEPPPPKA